jgi:phospholipid transport system substrate-binding protein
MMRAVLTLALGLAAAMGFISASSASTPEEQPSRFVERLSGDVLAILRDSAAPREARLDRLEALLERHSDFTAISKLVLAANYRTFSESQRKDFEVALRSYLTATYGNQIDNFSNETVEVLGERPEARGDFTVRSRIRRQAGADILVDYRLRPRGNEWIVLDITAEGVSLIANLRSQFQEILTRGGPDRLIRTLQDRNASGEIKAPSLP